MTWNPTNAMYGKPNGAKFKKQNWLHDQQIFIKVKADFNQAQQNQFTFNQFSLKVKTFRIKLNKITSSLSRNWLSRARDIGVTLNKITSSLSRKIYLNFTLRFISTPNSLSRFNNVTIQCQAANAVNNPNTLSTTTQSTINTVVNKYFVYYSWSIYRSLRSGFEACIEHNENKNRMRII